MVPQPQSGLQVLEISAVSDLLEAQSLECCGAIPSLDIFVWNAIRLAGDEPVSFLRCNLSFPAESSLSPSPTLLDTRILPMLSQSFKG